MKSSTRSIVNEFGKSINLSRKRRRFWKRICMLTVTLLATQSLLRSQTIVSGNVSGTWDPSGNPYVVGDQCTIPTGKTLVIQPGVTVILGKSSEIVVSGKLSASGTATNHITMRGANSASHWKRVFFDYGSSGSTLSYCDISDAQTAIWLGSSGNDGRLTITLRECSFANCVDNAVYCEATGTAYSDYWSQSHWHHSPVVAPLIQNCTFVDCGNGCVMKAQGQASTGAFGYAPEIGYGSACPTIFNCSFVGMTGCALNTISANYAQSSTGIVANVVVYGCKNGLAIGDPYDIIVKNSIFVDNTAAVSRGGTLSSKVGYNCFFGNRTNFVGYPAAYGLQAMQNHNGDPCDVLFNIFAEPAFVTGGSFTLADKSPCLDAGDPSAVYADKYFPPSKGTVVNDLGIYGGPNVSVEEIPPNITFQPESQATCLGRGAKFEVAAAGTQPLTYQWLFNGTALTGQMGSALTLDNLQSNQAGVYSVVVSNAFGTVTSDPAQLTLYDALVDIRMYAGLNVSGQAGKTYVLSYTTDLATTNWTALATNVMGNTGWLFIDMDSPFQPKRFYEATLQH